MQHYLTPKEVAAILRISERHVYRVLKSIPRIRVTSANIATGTTKTVSS